MKWIERFETKYVDVYRAVVVLVVVASLIGLLLTIGYWSKTKATPREYNAQDELSSPGWSDVKDSILPAIEEAVAPESDSGSPREKIEEKPLVDPRIVEIHIILSKQFERNKDGVQQFRTLVPRRYLQELLLENRLIPNSWSSQYIENIRPLATSLSNDGRINRISSLEGRAETLILAIQRFTILYRAAIDEAKLATRSLNKGEVKRQELADEILMKVLPIFVGVLFSILLLMVFIRIEVHLRKIAVRN